MSTNSYIVRALDSDGDWAFGTSLGNYLQNNAAVGQCIQTRITSFIADCFFDLGAGINWWYFLGGTNNELSLNLTVGNVILNTDFVTGIQQLSVNLNRQNRAFSVSYQVQTAYSTTGNIFEYSVGGS